MRLYGKKFVRNSMQKTALSRMETRDAILWDIQETSKVCRCKIQGSNEYIIAHYPQHWESTPVWLRPGAAIRINHLGGDRGLIEVVGPGRAIPTPVSGSSTPTPSTPPDTILAGCAVKACTRRRMAVYVETGTYKIAGTEYTLSEILMTGSPELLMGDGGQMGNIAAVVPIDAAGLIARYDMIYVGVDGVVHCSTKGYASSASETPPKDSIGNYPDHVLLAYLLVPGYADVIDQSYVNAEWSVSAPAYLGIAIDDAELAWGETETDITLKVYNQYNVDIAAPSGLFNFYLQILSGNGQVYSTQSGYSTDTVGYSGEMTGYFKYVRNGTSGDSSPSLRGYLDYGGSHFEIVGQIILLDSDGDPMRG